MKRLIIFFMLGELLLLCSGCEKKELECVKVEESSKVKITQTVKVTFSNEKINVYKNHLIFDITDDKGNYKDLLYTELEKNFKEYTNKNGINYIIKKENKQIMIMFPEGKRVREGEKADIKPGVAMIATHAKVPVVPVAISGKYRWLHRVTITYGEPIYLDEYYDEKLSEEKLTEISTSIMNRVYSMGAAAEKK